MNELFIKVHDTLPIFKIEHKQYQIVYTPGSFIILRNNSATDLKNMLNNPSQIENIQLQDAIYGVLNSAKQNVWEWERRKNEHFSPECLTIHVGYECNLNCEYCYSKIVPGNKLKGFPKIEDIKSTFDYLVKKRVANSDQVTVVFHGSGEPTFHWEELQKAHGWISAAAKKMGIKIFYYLATNGYLKNEKVTWIAKNIDLIGISCDGPAEIQQKQRGIEQYLPLTETCEILRSKNTKYDIRTTITPETVTKQLEIVKYFINDLQAERIRIEPVYLMQNTFQLKHSQEFFDNFIKAQEFAQQNGVSLEYSGVRVHELHGTYCDVLRSTLRLTPDGLLRNCFCKIQNNDELILGEIDNNQDHITINKLINEIKQKAFKIPEECNNCINVFHCSRGCPDFCIFDEQKPNKLNPFKCKLNQLIAVHQIKLMSDNNLLQNE